MSTSIFSKPIRMFFRLARTSLSHFRSPMYSVTAATMSLERVCTLFIDVVFPHSLLHSMNLATSENSLCIGQYFWFSSISCSPFLITVLSRSFDIHRFEKSIQISGSSSSLLIAPNSRLHRRSSCNCIKTSDFLSFCARLFLYQSISVPVGKLPVYYAPLTNLDSSRYRFCNSSKEISEKSAVFLHFAIP